MKTPTYGPWWFHAKYLEEGEDGTVHDDDCCDHRHFVSELNLGWRFWTPAGRLEVIERMEDDPGGYWWRIWTEETRAAAEKTGIDWSWRRRADDRVHAIPPNPVAGPRLWFFDLAKGSSGASMHLVPADAGDFIPDFNLTLVEAKHLGPGLGWRVTDRPDGGDEVITKYPTKAKARAALLRSGRRHATILGLEIFMGDDR